MVARPDAPGDASPPVVHALRAVFRRWRAWLGSGAARLRETRPERAVGPIADASSALVRAVRALGRSEADDERHALAAAGVAALAAGTGLSLALAAPLGIPRVEAAVAAAWTLGWTLVRLGILRLACPRLSPGRIGTAWAGGLLPAAIAVSDPLRLAALAASAWLTVRTLQGSGARREEAWRAVAWAFGTEVVAVAARWIASGVLLYLLVR